MKISVILSLICLYVSSYSQNWLWAHKIGVTLNDQGEALASDIAGNIYLAASNGYTFGGIVSKHDSSGNLIWARNCSNAHFKSIAISKTDGVYACGYFSSTTNFSGGSNPDIVLTSNGNECDGFLLKYDLNGNLLWVQPISSPNNFSDEVVAVKADWHSNIYVTGYSYKMVNNIYKKNTFVMKYDQSGNLLWTKDSNWRGNANSSAITIDEANNCYIAGGFSDSAFFGNTTLVSHPGSLFLTKYAPNGTLIWAKKDGKRSGAHSIHYSKGKLTMTGQFSDSTNFSGQLIVGSPYSLFVVQYDTLGNFMWVNNATGASGQSITRDNTGNTFITGVFKSNGATFNSTVITSPKQGTDMFVAKCDSAGTFRWVVGPTGSSIGSNFATSIVINKGRVIVTGKFADQTNFSAFSLVASPPAGINQDVFLAAIDDCELGLPTNLTHPHNLEIRGWPNPATKKFFIESNCLEISKVEIVNSLGQIISCIIERNLDILQIDIQPLTKGIYYIFIYSPTGLAIKKIIKS